MIVGFCLRNSGRVIVDFLLQERATLFLRMKSEMLTLKFIEIRCFLMRQSTNQDENNRVCNTWQLVEGHHV